MEKIVSWRPDWETICIEQELKQWDAAPDGSRNARFQRAIKEGVKVKDWSIIQEKLRDLKREEVEVPSSMQISIDPETSANLDQIRDTIKATSSTELKKPRLSYVFRLILSNYLLSLQKDETADGAEVVPAIEISGVDGVALLRNIADLLLLSGTEEEAREKIAKINSICGGM